MLSSDRIVNGSLMIGALVFVLLFISFSHVGWKVVERVVTPSEPPRMEQGVMGEEGAACGGAERLPCKPTFVCDTDDDAVYGRCIKDERETFPLGEEGAVCDEERGCQAPLVCNGVGVAPGVCTPANVQ